MVLDRLCRLESSENFTRFESSVSISIFSVVMPNLSSVSISIVNKTQWLGLILSFNTKDFWKIWHVRLAMEGTQG